jgi:hypothetical protein
LVVTEINLESQEAMNQNFESKARDLAKKYCGEVHGSLLRQGGGCQLCHLRAVEIVEALRSVYDEAIQEALNAAKIEPVRFLNESNLEWTLDGVETKKRICDRINLLKGPKTS